MNGWMRLWVVLASLWGLLVGGGGGCPEPAIRRRLPYDVCLFLSCLGGPRNWDFGSRLRGAVGPSWIYIFRREEFRLTPRRWRCFWYLHRTLRVPELLGANPRIANRFGVEPHVPRIGRQMM